MIIVIYKYLYMTYFTAQIYNLLKPHAKSNTQYIVDYLYYTFFFKFYLSHLDLTHLLRKL